MTSSIITEQKIDAALARFAISRNGKRAPLAENIFAEIVRLPELRQGELANDYMNALKMKPREYFQSVNDAKKRQMESAKIVDDESQSDDDEHFLLTEPADHDGHANCVARLYGENIAANIHLGWMYYDPRRHYWYRDDAETAVKRAVTATLRVRNEAARKRGNDVLARKTICDSANVNGTMAQLRSKKTIVIPIDEFDANPDLLNCANGVVDLRTGEIFPHEPQQKYSYCIATEYNPSADQSLFVDFLKSLEFSDEKIEYLQTAIGYSLTGHTREECMFYLFGVPRSGKGTIMQSLLDLLGAPLAVGTNFSTFTAERNNTDNFDLAPLRPCRLVSASESDRNDKLNSALVKQITGSDPVRCAFKHRDHFAYTPRFKIFLSSNFPPHIPPDDVAAWSRVRVIEFTKSFLGSEDKFLKSRLGSDAGRQALLAWAVDGAKRWYKTGLPTVAEITNSTNAQREKADTVGEYIRENYKIDLTTVPGGKFPEAAVLSRQLYTDYKNWCADEGLIAQGRPRFNAYIEQELKLTSAVGTRDGLNGKYVFGLRKL